MSGLEWAGLITAVGTVLTTLLALLGASIRYIVAMILDAYKAQTRATIEAKDHDLSQKDETIDKQAREIVRLHGRLEAMEGVILTEIRSFRKEVSS